LCPFPAKTTADSDVVLLLPPGCCAVAVCAAGTAAVLPDPVRVDCAAGWGEAAETFLQLLLYVPAVRP